MTTCRELKAIVQNAAEDAGIKGVMELARLVKDEKGLSYERVSRVWGGSTTAKFSDVEDVLDVLFVRINWDHSKDDK